MAMKHIAEPVILIYIIWILKIVDLLRIIKQLFSRQTLVENCLKLREFPRINFFTVFFVFVFDISSGMGNKPLHAGQSVPASFLRW